MKKIENLQHIPISKIFKNVNTFLVADTTQSRLRRGTHEMKRFIKEIETEITNDISNLKTKDYSTNLNKRINYNTITITDVMGGNTQYITDGWSRITQTMALVLGFVLYFQKNKWDVSDILNYLKINEDEFKFKFLEDYNIQETLQVNSLVKLVCSEQINISDIENYSKLGGSFQYILFSQQVYESYNAIESWNLLSVEESLNTLDNVLDTFWILPQFVLEHTDREKTFLNMNLKQKNLTPDCEDSVMAYEDSTKYGLPKDPKIYYIIDEYIQKLSYHIKSYTEVTGGRGTWFYYLSKSQVSDLYFKRKEDDNREKLRTDILKKLSETFINNESKLTDNCIIQMKKSLEELNYESDFKLITELEKRSLPKIWWSLYLRLHKNDKMTEEVERLIYFLSQVNRFLDKLWPGWDNNWNEPLLKNPNLLSKPFDTIYESLVKKTIGTRYDIVEELSVSRVNDKITNSKRKPLAFIDDITSYYCKKRYPELSNAIYYYMNNDKLEQSSIEHVHSQNAESDSKQKCLDIGGNQFFIQKWDNSRYGNKDYDKKREMYLSDKNQIPTSLYLFQFGTEGITLNENISSELKELFKDLDVSTLEKWNGEIIKDNKDNKFIKVYRVIFNDMFKLKNLKQAFKSRKK